MAYHHAETSHTSDLPHRVIAALKSAFSHIGHALVSASAANRQLQLAQKLQEKSDEELAELGLRREDIVRYAFRDMLHI